jgi:hypothetical protein
VSATDLVQAPRRAPTGLETPAILYSVDPVSAESLPSLEDRALELGFRVVDKTLGPIQRYDGHIPVSLTDIALAADPAIGGPRVVVLPSAFALGAKSIKDLVEKLEWAEKSGIRFVALDNPFLDSENSVFVAARRFFGGIQADAQRRAMTMWHVDKRGRGEHTGRRPGCLTCGDPVTKSNVIGKGHPLSKSGDVLRCTRQRDDGSKCGCNDYQPKNMVLLGQSK